MPTFLIVCGGQREAAAECYDAVTMGFLQQLQCRWWELRERLWYRHVFTAELGEAVVGTYEEVEATDVMRLIVWRPM